MTIYLTGRVRYNLHNSVRLSRVSDAAFLLVTICPFVCRRVTERRRKAYPSPPSWTERRWRNPQLRSASSSSSSYPCSRPSPRYEMDTLGYPWQNYVLVPLFAEGQGTFQVPFQDTGWIPRFETFAKDEHPWVLSQELKLSLRNSYPCP